MPNSQAPARWSNRFADLGKRRERILVIGLAVLGTLLISTPLFLATEPQAGYTSKIREIGSHLLRDLGIALVIAAALALAVDEYLKEKLVSSVSTEVSRHVAENTSNYVFGYFVPPDLKEELLDVMRPAVLRRNFRLHIALDYLGESHPNFVRVTTKVSFTLENLKDQLLPFRHSLRMTSMFAEIEAPEVLRFASRAKPSDEYAYDYQGFDSMLNATDSLLEVHRSDDRRELIVRRTMMIPPFSTDFEFRTESTEVMKVPYADVLSFTYVTAAIEIETRCPKDMDVLIEFGKGREVQIYKDPPNRPCLWRYSGVCLAGQHIKYDFKRSIIT